MLLVFSVQIFLGLLCRTINSKSLIPLCKILICMISYGNYVWFWFSSFNYCWFNFPAFTESPTKGLVSVSRRVVLNKSIKIQNLWDILYYWLNIYGNLSLPSSWLYSSCTHRFFLGCWRFRTGLSWFQSCLFL